MMGKRNAAIILSLLLFIANNSFAGNDKDDLRLRMGIELEKKLNKKLELEIVPEIRLRSRNELEELFIETGLQYDLFKHLKIGAYYRIYLNGEESITHRFAADIKPHIKWNDFKLQYRLRYTNYTDFDLTTDENFETLRNRIKLDYKIPKLDISPYIAYQLFYFTNQKEFKKIRYVFGVKLPLNKNSSLNAYYIVQKNLKKDNLQNILGFSCAIDLK